YRILFSIPKSLSPESQDQLAKLQPLNLFRMLAGGEGLLRAFVKFGNHLWFKADLPPVLREIAILRVGALSNARYEVFQHERIARGLGMSEDLIAAIRRGPDDPAFDELQRLVVRFTDDIVHNVRASDATFQPLAEPMPVRQLQELTLGMGYYMTGSGFLGGFGMEMEGAGEGSAP